MNKRRRNLLEYIAWYRDNFNASPTVKEITFEFDYSDGTARHHLSILVRLNRIARNPKKARSIRVINTKP